MFYSSELLSLKSKTEISILFYVSTTKTHNKISKKQILNLNISILIDEIINPSIPFSLRLYSHLLIGISKIWKIKLELYSKNITKLERPKRERIRKPNKNLTNLAIEEAFMDHVSDMDSSISSFKNLISQDVQIDYDHIFDHNEYGMISDLEDMRKTSDIQLIENFTGVKKSKIDCNTTLEVNKLFSIKTGEKMMKIDDPIDCFVVKYFRDFLVSIRKQKEEVCDSFEPLSGDGNEGKYFDCNEDPWNSNIEMSIEDRRNSNSMVQSISDLSVIQIKNECMELSEWFYNILVDASLGKIEVFQESAFEEIQIFSI